MVRSAGLHWNLLCGQVSRDPHASTQMRLAGEGSLESWLRCPSAQEVTLGHTGTTPEVGRVQGLPAGILHCVNGSLALLLPSLHVSLWETGSCYQEGCYLHPLSSWDGAPDHPSPWRQRPAPSILIFPPENPLPHRSGLSANTWLPCLRAFAPAVPSAWHIVPSGPHAAASFSPYK